MHQPDIAINTSEPRKTETKTHVIYRDPRISAAKLAEYIVSDPSRQAAIVKNAKNAPLSIIPQYRRVRGTFQHALTAAGLNPAYFLNLAEEVQASQATTDWQKGDKTRTIEALKIISEGVHSIECADATAIHGKWRPLLIAGVSVSVAPEFVFSILHRGVTKVGAVILNTPQTTESSLAKGGKYCAGDYLTTLLYLMLAGQAKEIGMPLHSRCYAIDIFRKEKHTTPASFKTLTKHMEEACKMIALRWDSIPSELEVVQNI